MSLFEKLLPQFFFLLGGLFLLAGTDLGIIQTINSHGR